MIDDDSAAELRSAVHALRAQLEWQRSCGGDWLPTAGGAARQPAAAASTVRAAAGAGATAEPRRGPARAGAQAAAPPPVASAPAAVPPADGDVAVPQTLAALRAHIGDCSRCKLAGGRTHVVFGVGSEQADLMFVGEGPGHDEDLQAEPFVGRAGQLLTEIITKGMKLQRGDVYIANVVKCRPPNNRNPEGDEIASCMPFLQRQIDIVAPRVIVALGTFAAQTLLGVKTPITRMRGTWHDYRGIKVMPTFHPAYLLRTPGDKRLVWADIKLVMGELGLPV
jgi:DNA polymerase